MGAGLESEMVGMSSVAIFSLWTGGVEKSPLQNVVLMEIGTCTEGKESKICECCLNNFSCLIDSVKKTSDVTMVSWLFKK